MVDTNTVGLLAMGSISEHAALEVGAGNGGELEGSRETLLTTGIVVLQGNLKFDGLNEVTLLSSEFLSGFGDGSSLRKREDIGHGLFEKGGVKLVGHLEVGVGLLLPSNEGSSAMQSDDNMETNT